MKTFVFSWDMYGIESIIDVSEYEHIDRDNTLRILKGEEKIRNPIHSILQGLLIRARFNTQRHYEIYAVDCDDSLDTDFWTKQWKSEPQFTADLIRERGRKLYSDRLTKAVKIS